MIRIWIMFLAASCGACAAPVRDAPAPGASEPRKTIYLVSHGWHAGIVLRRADIPDSIWPAPGDFPNAQYLEVGWGDMDFYQTPDPHMGLILKAALLPTASVLHIVGFNGPVPAYFPYSEIIRIELSSAGFEHLSRTIAASFALDEAGNARSLGPGLYGNSRFYLSGETYHLFNTCNVWTARALRVAGLPISPTRSISVEGLMSQARKFGAVVQSGPEASEYGPVQGDHGRHWSAPSRDFSDPMNLQVPIFAGTARWATVEMCFTPISSWSFSGIWSSSPDTRERRAAGSG